MQSRSNLIPCRPAKRSIKPFSNEPPCSSLRGLFYTALILLPAWFFLLYLFIASLFE